MPDFSVEFSYPEIIGFLTKAMGEFIPQSKYSKEMEIKLDCGYNSLVSITLTAKGNSDEG